MSKFVIGIDKDSKNRLECFKFAEEATTFSTQARYIMSEVGVDAFYVMGIFFVPIVAVVFSIPIDIQINAAAVRAIFLSEFYAVYD